jgi:hypothetical protein
MTRVAGTRIVLDPTPPAHFGVGAVDAVAGIVNGTGCRAAVIVTDEGLAGPTGDDIRAILTGALDGHQPCRGRRPAHPGRRAGTGREMMIPGLR